MSHEALRQMPARPMRRMTGWAVARAGAGTRERTILALLVAATALLGTLSVAVGPGWVPPATLIAPMLVGGMLLGARHLRMLLVAVTVAVAYDIGQLGWHAVRLGAVALLVVTGALAVEFARTRELLGISGARSESMLLELRDRLRAQGELPPLPGQWHTDVVQRSAGGASFSGDFLVSALTRDQRVLEVVLVDVSGKGVDAGTRALQLSGALGGLLGSVPSAEFLPAANAYVVRQDWPEGFATAVHLTLELGSGRYRIASAGHPPAAHLDGGSGRWRLSTASGPLLGVLPDVSFGAETGILQPGDAVLLFTDGLVEVPGRDLAFGIDKLLGEAERLVPRGFARGAEALVNAVAPRANDDRALLLLWRS